MEDFELLINSLTFECRNPQLPVVKVAKDFDRTMKLKYAKKWKFAEDDLSMTSEDRAQAIVEEMSRIEKEEPEFYQRVMSDIERM